MAAARNPWSQYINPLVMLISVVLTSNTISATLPLRYTRVSAPSGISYAAATTGAVGAIALSAFVFIGLKGIGRRSTVLMTSTGARNPEEVFGSQIFAERLVLSGEVLSVFGGVLNALVLLVTNIGYEASGDSTWSSESWLTASIVLAGVSNLIGFVLFNILGARNDVLLTAQHAALEDRYGVLQDRNRTVGSVSTPATASTDLPISEPGAGAMPFAAAASDHDPASAAQVIPEAH